MENQKNPRIETAYAFTKDMNDDLVEKIHNSQGSAISKKKFLILEI